MKLKDAKRTDSKILRRLEEWQKKPETPPELAEFYQKLLRIQSRARQRIEIPGTADSHEAVSARLDKGLPLILFEDLVLDWPLLRHLFAEVTVTFAEYPRLFGECSIKMRELSADHLLTRETVRAWFEGTNLPSVTDGISDYLFASAIQATLQPLLATYSQTLLQYVNQEHWRRAYCPICGGNPDFALLDKERGARWLLCSRCDNEWLFQRMECPFCGNQNQNTLAYFTDDDGLYRLYTCEQCKQYLKTIDLRQTKENIEIPLERLFTLGIDMQAREYGYGQPNQLLR